VDGLKEVNTSWSLIRFSYFNLDEKKDDHWLMVIPESGGKHKDLSAVIAMV